MFETISPVTHSPLAVLGLALGSLGVVLAMVTLALWVARKRGAVQVVALLCLLVAGASLLLGALDHALGMAGVLAALPNVPFDLRAELLLKGTREARMSLVIAMTAAAFPLLVGSIAVFLTRFRVGRGVSVVVAVGLVASLVAQQQPLPSGKVVVAPVEGLQLPSSTAQRRPGAQPLITLMPDGLRVEGSKVSSLTAALEDPRVRAQNRGVLPLSVDGRVTFSALADVLEAAGDRHQFELVVHSPAGELAVISVRDAASITADPPGPPSLRLTLRVTGTQVQVLAIGGALDPLPVDWPKVQEKMMEIKASFPGEVTLRLAAAPEVSMDVLVKALDATRENAQRRLLFPDAVVGRFESPEEGAPRAAVSLRGPEVGSTEIDREKLAAYVRSRKGAIQRCYEKELARAPTLRGKIVVLFSITPEGRTADLDIEENTLGNDAVAHCLQLVIRGWVLPFKPATTTTIAYPFVFAPAS